MCLVNKSIYILVPAPCISDGQATSVSVAPWSAQMLLPVWGTVSVIHRPSYYYCKRFPEAVIKCEQWSHLWVVRSELILFFSLYFSLFSTKSVYFFFFIRETFKNNRDPCICQSKHVLRTGTCEVLTQREGLTAGLSQPASWETLSGITPRKAH